MTEARGRSRPFEFLSAGRIVFGSGTSKALGERASKLGKRALVVTGRDAERSRSLVLQLKQAGMELELVSVGGEPRVQDALDAVVAGRRVRAQLVVALGGGSAIDLGKAAAALLANPQDPFDFLEIVGRGKPLGAPALPLIAVPTTAGTGAEVTKNAVLTSPAHAVKVSLRHDSMLPSVALVDPELTLSMPPAVTAATGLDALTQCLEPYVSCQSNPITDALALEGLRRGALSLERAYRDGLDLAAREDMALCSLLGGLALANAKLGAVHGFAAPIGGLFPAPHGAVCARLLPLVMAANVQALQAREPRSAALARFAAVARTLTGSESASIADGIGFVERLGTELGVPGLASYGMTSTDVAGIVGKAANTSSMQGNPVQLSPSELSEILERAL